MHSSKNYSHQNESIITKFLTSKNGLYRIYFFDKSDGTPISIIKSVEKKYYICAQRGGSFRIAVKSLQKPNDDGAFSPRLYIDGEEVRGFRTGRIGSWMNYFGFKLGNGNYKEFVFSEPPPICSDEEENIFGYGRRNDKFGIIEFEFFHGIFEWDKKRPKHNFQYVKHNQLRREDDKKYFQRSVNVGEGRDFSLVTELEKFHTEFEMHNIDPEFSQLRNRNGKRGREFPKAISYTPNVKIDFDVPVDEATIKYLDFFSLQIQGIIHFGNISHLKFIPTANLREPFYLQNALIAIIQNTPSKSIELDDLAFEFKKQTDRELNECLEKDEVAEYLIKQKSTFKYKVETNEVSLTVQEFFAQEKEKKIIPHDHISNNYFGVKRDKLLKKSGMEKKFSREYNIQSLLENNRSFDSIWFDLTEKDDEVL